MNEVRVGDRRLELCNGGHQRGPQCEVALDTGTSLLLGPPEEVRLLLDAIGLEDDCSNYHKLPTLQFQLGDFAMVLAPGDYGERSTDGCAAVFQEMELPPSLGQMWVFGQAALRKYYTVYDAGRWRVGVGLARHAAQQRHDDGAGAAASQPIVVPHQADLAEVCMDDDKDMLNSSLPACRSFAQMGYCRRFPPLAQHYCRRACSLCSGNTSAAPPSSPSRTPNLTMAAGSTGGSPMNSSLGSSPVRARRLGPPRPLGGAEITEHGQQGQHSAVDRQLRRKPLLLAHVGTRPSIGKGVTLDAASLG